MQVLHVARPAGQAKRQVRHLVDVRPQVGVGRQDVANEFMQVLGVLGVGGEGELGRLVGKLV